MNQTEWKRLSRLPKEQRIRGIFKFRNQAEKLLGYKRCSGMVIHHLRDTEEQRQFNDNHYERWGIDFDGKMKYCVLLTVEEHQKIHYLSEETKEKISKSVSKAKKKYTEEELKQHRRECDRKWKERNEEKLKKYDKEYYLKNKEKIKKRIKEYKKTHREMHNTSSRKWKAMHKDHIKKQCHEWYLKKKQKQLENKKGTP